MEAIAIIIKYFILVLFSDGKKTSFTQVPVKLDENKFLEQRKRAVCYCCIWIDFLLEGEDPKHCEAFKSSLLSQQSVLFHLRFTHPFSKADTSHLSVLSRVELFCFICVTVSSGNVFSHLRICRNLAPDSKGNNL